MRDALPPGDKSRYIQCLPIAGTRFAGPPATGPRRFLPGQPDPPAARFIEYNSVLSPGRLRGLSRRLLQTPAPAADAPISLRHLSRQPVHFALWVEWRGVLGHED